MEVLHVTLNGEHMNTLEKFHIYVETKNDNQINEKCMEVSNTLFGDVTSNDITNKA
jgi:hypothetical protein